MVRRLAGKVALVTGGGKGIGFGITQRFLEEGARVAVVQRTPPEDRNVTEQALFVQADLSRSQEVNTAVDTVFKKFGGLDILVNNAGIMFEKTVEEMSEADWDQMMAINLKAPFLLTKRAMPFLRRNHRGSIINIGSIEGLASNPGHPAYLRLEGRDPRLHGGGRGRSRARWRALQRDRARLDQFRAQ